MLRLALHGALQIMTRTQERSHAVMAYWILSRLHASNAACTAQMLLLVESRTSVMGSSMTKFALQFALLVPLRAAISNATMVF
jgi:hypothetical protein